jgi:ABC-type amino acid transport substrate-binding protein
MPVALLKRLILLSLLFLPGVAAAQPVVIGVSEDYPPYAYRDSFGQVTGFDVDVAAQICAQLGQDCRFEMRPLAGLLRGISEGGLDIAIGGLAATPARAEMGNLTCPLMYFQSRNEMFYARSTAVNVNSATIATVRGSLQERALVQRGLRLAVFETTEAAVRAALNGQTDAFFGTERALDTVAGAAQALVEVGRMEMPPVGAAFMVSRQRPDLLAAWNGQILQMFDSGGIDRLHAQYGNFNGDFPQTRQLSVACLRGNRPLF